MTTTNTTNRVTRLAVFLDDKALASMNKCMAISSELVGHSVPRSVAIRRALALLARHLESIKTPKQETAERAELGTVLRS